MNDFAADNRWQLMVRDTVLAPGFYGAYALDGRYVFIDKGRLATRLQRDYAVDTIVQSEKTGAAVCVEEKIVRWKGYDYEAVCLETESCTVPGHEKPGWMHYGRADLLLYGMMKAERLDVHLYNFEQLQAWFWQHADEFEIFQMTERNRTRGRKVPMHRIADSGAVWHWHRSIYPNPQAEHFDELFPQLAHQEELLL